MVVISYNFNQFTESKGWGMLEPNQFIGGLFKHVERQRCLYLSQKATSNGKEIIEL